MDVEERNAELLFRGYNKARGDIICNMRWVAELVKGGMFHLESNEDCGEGDP